MPVLARGVRVPSLQLFVLVEDEVPDLQEARVSFFAAGAVLGVYSAGSPLANSSP